MSLKNNPDWTQLYEQIRKAAQELSLNDWEKLLEDAIHERDKAKYAELNEYKDTPQYKELEKELNEHKNELVLARDKVYRLAGISAAESDLYWIMDDGRKVELHTCVCGWIPLKKYFPLEVYNQILTVWNYNTDIKAQ
jgi:hypothetical protein